MPPAPQKCYMHSATTAVQCQNTLLMEIYEAHKVIFLPVCVSEQSIRVLSQIGIFPLD